MQPLDSRGCAPSASPHPARRFYVDQRLLDQAVTSRRCYAASASQLDAQARSQYLFELDVFDALAQHPLRTSEPTASSLSVLPILALASEYVGHCIGPDGNATSHIGRMRRVRQALYKAAWRAKGPFLYTCTCVMQHHYYGNGLMRMLEHLGPRLIQLVKEPNAKNTVTRSQIVVPYHSSPFFRVEATGACEQRPNLAMFMGSVWTGTSTGSRVRKHIRRVADAEPRVRFHKSHRRGAGCEEKKTCVKSIGVGPPAKAEMAREMRRSAFCLVPLGDSPASSRLYDAIASLCVPVVIIDGPLLVPASPYWEHAVITFNATAFLRTSPSLIARALHEQLERRHASLCRSLSALRSDLRAECVLTRALAANLSGARGRTIEGVAATQVLHRHVPFSTLPVGQ